MTPLFLIVVLALIWVAVTGTFTLVNLLFGLVLAFGAVWVLRADFARPRSFRRARQVLSLSLLFLGELLVSALRVAAIVVTPNIGKRLNPAIIAMPLTVRSDAEITLLACLITLTPGTLSVDVSEDRKTLFVHVLHLRDREAVIAGIQNGFEKRISEIFA